MKDRIKVISISHDFLDQYCQNIGMDLGRLTLADIENILKATELDDVTSDAPDDLRVLAWEQLGLHNDYMVWSETFPIVDLLQLRGLGRLENLEVSFTVKRDLEDIINDL